MKTVTGHAGASRRQHERTFKAELVRQSLEPGASVSAIALAGGVNANLLFKWRRDHLRASVVSRAAPPSTVLVPVHVASGGDDENPPQLMPPPASSRPAMPALRTGRGGVIELDIAGAQLRLRGPVDEASLCSVLRAAPEHMIGPRAGTRVWLAAGVTDMRCGIDSLAFKVQATLAADPYGGHVFAFRGRRGDLVKLLWSDGDGMCLLTMRLERGRFIWSHRPADRVVQQSPVILQSRNIHDRSKTKKLITIDAPQQPAFRAISTNAIKSHDREKT